MIPEPDPVAPAAPPALTPEMVLWRSTTRALVQTLGPKKADRFLRAVAEDVAEQVSFTDATPIRADRAELARTRDAVFGAYRAFRRALPQLLASLPE
jgi:hypothetical protein